MFLSCRRGTSQDCCIGNGRRPAHCGGRKVLCNQVYFEPERGRSIVIHRHGLTPEIARVVEAALIDAYPGLRNKINGEKSDLGSRSAFDLIREYGQPEIPVGEHFLMFVNVAGSLGEQGKDVKEAAAYAWKINEVKWGDSKPIVLAYSSQAYGEVLGVFRVEGVVTSEEFRMRDQEKFPEITERSRKGLILAEIDEDLRRRYLGRRVPARWRQPAPTYPR